MAPVNRGQVKKGLSSGVDVSGRMRYAEE